MNTKSSPGFIAGILVALFFGLALYFRIVLPFDKVFVGEWIKFTGNDAWYHMRIIDNLAHNFPHLNTIDPYLLYPVPMGLGTYPFFDYFVAAIIQIVTLGNPAQHITDMVGVYLPAVLGALVILPVFFIGKALVNRWVGVIAAGLIAFSPGEFLGRSIIGQADHHVFEVICSTTVIMFIILALKNARQRQVDFPGLIRKEWQVAVRPLVYSFLAGILLALYLNSWLGALVFVFILFAYVIVQHVIDYIRLRKSDYLVIVFSVVFLVTLIVTLLLRGTDIQIAALAIAFLTTIILSILSNVIMKKSIKPIYYLLAIVGLGLVATAMLYLVKNDLFLAIVAQFKTVIPTGARLTIQEAHSIIFPSGKFSLEVVWLNFTTGSLLCLVALGILIYSAIKNDRADTILIVVWSLIILGLTLLMRRFAYYFAVNVAILTAYVSWLILELFGFRKTLSLSGEIPADIPGKMKRKKAHKKDSRISSSPLKMGLGVVIVFFLALFPSIIYAKNTASYPQFTPGDAWCESLDWLRENTLEPYGDAEFYYARYDKSFTQPNGSYGIAAHWDYGYWIAKFAHRPPLVNPGVIDKRKSVAEYFLSQDEKAAIANQNARDSKYIMMDYDTAIPLKKYYSWLEYAGINQQNYFDVYIQRSGTKLNAVLFYYPEYYRSLAVRLYNFDGKEISPGETLVISYEEKTDRKGNPYKEITAQQSFPLYEAAVEYVARQTTGKFRIVGTDPFISPVPLGALQSYRPAYSSTEVVGIGKTGSMPKVKIFEYSP